MRVKLKKSLTLALSVGTEVELSEAQYKAVANFVEVVPKEAKATKELITEGKVEKPVEGIDAEKLSKVPKGIKAKTKDK